MDDGLMNQEEVADRLGVSARTVRNYVRRAWLPQVQLGRTVRYEKRDVDALIQKARQLGVSRARRNLGLEN